MRDEDVISGSTILFWGHPGARLRDAWIPPAYDPPFHASDSGWVDRPDYAAWFPQARFAPAGPAYAFLPTWQTVIPLYGVALPAEVPADLPEALLDEPAVLDRIADVVADEEPGTVPEEPLAAESPDEPGDEPTLEETAAPADWSPPEPEPVSPAFEHAPSAYWATTTDPARNAELHGRPTHPAEVLDEHGPAGAEPWEADRDTPAEILHDIPPATAEIPEAFHNEPGEQAPEPVAELEPDFIAPLQEPVVAIPPSDPVIPEERAFHEQPPVAADLAPEPQPLTTVADDAVEEAASPAVQWDTHPERLVPPPPADEVPVAEPASPQPGPAAYWAKSKWAEPAETRPDQQDSLAWTPPSDAPAGATAKRRTTPAMEGLWATAGLDAEDDSARPQPWTPRRMVRRAAPVAAGLGVLVAACLAALLFLPRVFVSNQVPAATFNAPMMVLRAAAPGQVTSLGVQNGQSVAPDTLLLTIRTQPPPDPAAALLRDRLSAAQAHLAELDQALAQPATPADASRARIADLRRQRAMAATDVAQLQDGIANIPPQRSADLPVKAGVHGVIRSLEARSGATIATGAPLVRMLDCDHAFLTTGPNTQLHAGEAVQVRLPNLPPVPATVRQSAGIAEPPDSLVIATAPGAFVGLLSGSCPVGATATVTPSMTGS